ncbi:hypothetical protein GOP47_0012263 [Adiantum capillus-veneris]|uniref:AAA+ ATPase domain-containing protein n=1 Tax=Adiantum capillus-veneris TaxID=13818 RepID=A0A9D4ZFI1_ADICA|nr:hypothetical protein GOP47_0012263 [Adiantum capillus-veneris]
MDVQAVVHSTACLLHHSLPLTAASVPHILCRRLDKPPRRHQFFLSPVHRKGCLRGPIASFASLGFSADPRIRFAEIAIIIAALYFVKWIQSHDLCCAIPYAFNTIICFKFNGRTVCYSYATVSIERAANNILKDAASLLLYQEVLRVPAAQAFLKVLLSLRRGDEGWKLLDTYGEFYRLMAAGYHLSWEELILEGILTGEGNPFAEASANVGNPRSQWLKGVPPSLQAAAAADLDSLQRLSVTECTLVGWVMELVPDVRPEWKVAAESTLSSREVKKIFTSSGNDRSMSDMNSSELDNFVLKSHLAVGYSREVLIPGDRGSDSLAHNREAWRRKIGGLWRWSEAIPLLQEYYSQYGIGRTACEQALQCRGVKLIRDVSFYAYKDACNLSVLKEHYEGLSKHLERHISHTGASHILVHGPSGSGRTSLVKSVLYRFAKQGKLRVIQMQKGETKHIQGILEELAKNWQLRFVLMVDGLSTNDDLVYTEWPENVILCGISLLREPSTNKLADEFRDVFGTILTLDNLDLQSYLLSVEEMLDHNMGHGIKPAGGSWKSHIEQAELWAKDRKVLSIRTAAQFVNKFKICSHKMSVSLQ